MVLRNLFLAQYSIRSSKGFSIIEILLVVILLSVVAGLTIPNFSGTYRRVQLKNVAQDLAYLMRYGQSRAVAKNKKIRLEFDTDYSSYWLTEEASVEGWGDSGVLYNRISGRLARNREIPDNIIVEADDLFITFYPDGSIDKKAVLLCDEDKCFTVTTGEQRGHVWVLESG